MRNRRYAMTMTLIVGVLFVGSLWLNVAYTKHVEQQSDRRQTELRHRQDVRWCALLASLDQPQAPATTTRGRVVQQQIHQLRLDLGCL